MPKILIRKTCALRARLLRLVPAASEAIGQMQSNADAVSISH
jgi:hypothetical protein